MASTTNVNNMTVVDKEDSGRQPHHPLAAMLNSLRPIGR